MLLWATPSSYCCIVKVIISTVFSTTNVYWASVLLEALDPVGGGNAISEVSLMAEVDDVTKSLCEAEHQMVHCD